MKLSYVKVNDYQAIFSQTGAVIYAGVLKDLGWEGKVLK